MPTALLVPETALLVPGVSGRSRVLEGLSAAAMAAARRLLEAAPERVAVLAPGPAARRVDAARLCSSLAPLGIPERGLAWPAPCLGAGCTDHSRAPGARRGATTGTAVALRLLGAAGWVGATTVVELSGPDVPVGDEAAAQVLVVVGSLSARRGEGSPRASDPRAVETDTQLAADLLSPPGRLAALDEGLADELLVSGAAPWRHLARLVGGRRVSAVEEASELALGMDYRVVTWRWDA